MFFSGLKNKFKTMHCTIFSEEKINFCMNKFPVQLIHIVLPWGNTNAFLCLFTLSTISIAFILSLQNPHQKLLRNHSLKALGKLLNFGNIQDEKEMWQYATLFITKVVSIPLYNLQSPFCDLGHVVLTWKFFTTF